MFQTKAQISQIVNIDDDTLKELQKVEGNVFIVNTNSGSISTNNSERPLLSECLYGLYLQGDSLNTVLYKVRRMYVEFAMADTFSVTAAAEKLGVHRTALHEMLKRIGYSGTGHEHLRPHKRGGPHKKKAQPVKLLPDKEST
jgi:hypothetical protein